MVSGKRNFFLRLNLTETGKDDAKKGDQMEKLQQGEEVDIDLTDPEVHKAASKIQASFRGHKAREDVKKHKDEEAAALKIQASFRGHQAREKVKEIKLSRSKELVSEDKKTTDSIEKHDETMPEEVGKAEESTKQEPVQEPVTEVTEGADTSEPAAEDQVEEMKVVADEGETNEVAGGEEAGESTAEEAKGVVADTQVERAEGGLIGGEEEQVDVDLNDPKLHSAAVKIQASFRGHKAREEAKSLKSSESLAQTYNEVPLEEKDKVDDEEPSVVEERENSN